MLCEKCQERPATVFYTELINGLQKKMQLCEVCANQLQGVGGIPQMNLHNFLASFWNQMSGMQHLAPKTKEEQNCSACGTTERLFAQKGLLGCGDCYQHWGNRLEPLLRRIHGSSTHTGKVPKRTGGKVLLARKIEELRAGLRDAIAREEFEKAAVLRDDIKKLEQQL